ncbi:hypothetical protein [Kerstersia gyiorum]|jgi:hypothetical protein|uniref:Membrane protein n=1 Tax=Kerstersia gyiorum TaxID=206506 RepID=A0A171KQ52_9BURK|nr:hypothetical protein [Kerstersia gyiorum]MCO7640510.1 hypothetical protein [Pseudomonas sp. S 311-6]KAB0544130.1 hypothetical protein F7P85_05800 [Kerstersia gyiorum]KKO71019.1 membrane protein [Kerstersia gyiorum]MCH4272358.1 hypothetical protein [Kerstersia gyiorum]MCP1631873.1 hypothetical protein [Kerstersia gyiorum]
MAVSFSRLAVLACLLLTGCGGQQAPYIVLFESYFPSWIACATFGCLSAVVLRFGLIRMGIDEHLPLRFLTYLAFALAVMFISSLLVFSR